MSGGRVGVVVIGRNDHIAWGGTNMLALSSVFYDVSDAPASSFTMREEPLRRRILDAARACGEAVAETAVYAASQGPRLETAAEIDRLERDGVDVVGMTGMPEAALAREAGVDYAAIAVVANFAAGRGDSLHAIRMDDIEQVLQQSLTRVRRIIEQLASQA